MSRGLAVAVPAAFYARTVAPTVYGLDSAELTTAAATLSIPHPPGYPLYVLVGRLWIALVPVGDAGFRMNLLSAVFAVLAVGLLFEIVRLLTGRVIPALAASWLLGLSYSFWSQSVIAETYTLETALLAASLLALLKWRECGARTDLVLAFLCMGLGAAHRTSSLVFLPAAGAFLLANRHRLGDGWWRVVVAAVAPLGLYLLLPVRSAVGAPYVWGSPYALTDATTQDVALWRPSVLWRFVSGQDFALLLALPPLSLDLGAWSAYLSRVLQGAAEYAQWLTWDSMWAGIPLGILGLWALTKVRSDVAVLLGLGFVGYVGFFASYLAWDRSTMLLPAHLLWAVLVGCGIGAAISIVPERIRTAVPANAAVACLIVLALAYAFYNLPSVDSSSDSRARDQAEEVLSLVEPNAVIVGNWNDVAPLLYLQHVEGKRPDVRLVQTWALDPLSLIVLVRSNVRERPVYFLSDEQVVLYDSFLRVIPADKWYRVVPKSDGAEQAQSRSGGEP